MSEAEHHEFVTVISSEANACYHCGQPRDAEAHKVEPPLTKMHGHRAGCFCKDNERDPRCDTNAQPYSETISQSAPERIWIDPRYSTWFLSQVRRVCVRYVREDVALDRVDTEITRLQDGIRDHLISLGAPDSLIDGAGCDSGDPLDFTKAEITQAFNYFEGRLSLDRAISIVRNVSSFRDVGIYTRTKLAEELRADVIAALEAERCK